MKKILPQTKNITDENIESIGQLFPQVVTESIDESGNTKKVVDFELLKQHLSDNLVDGSDERYRLDWPGKRASILKANTPINKTLRPDRESSVNFDETENVYIEGDNFEVLKVLQESYLGKIKMIYIDPPYNTGKDFVYTDRFTVSKDDYEDKIGAEDSEGGKLFKNTDTNGRFHSDWLSMMYERLIVARDLLTDDGVIFMSIDDNEFHNLRKIADEVFGEENFIADFIWNSTKSVTNTAIVSVSHNYNLTYFKNIDFYKKNRENFRIKESGVGFSNPDDDPRGPWKADPFQVGGWRPNQQYEIVNPKTGEVYTPNTNASWKNDYQKFQELTEDNRIVFGTTGDAGPQRKRFLSEALERGRVMKTWWDDVETTANGTQTVKKLFDNQSLFTNPKPVGLISRMLELSLDNNEIVLDFFSGSASTAHATMQLNAEDGSNRKFIMVQLPEETDEKSEAYKAGYKTISEIGMERIRRAGKKIIEENAEKLAERETPLDTGFRVYKTDSSNIKDVYYNPAELKQENLLDAVDNIKDDRTSEDLLTQVILDLGLTLDLPIEKKDIDGSEVFYVAGNSLIACFDNGISDTVLKTIAESEPIRLVFRDSSFKQTEDKINVETIFKSVSPDTKIIVL